jgi:hypothetical protein
MVFAPTLHDLPFCFAFFSLCQLLTMLAFLPFPSWSLKLFFKSSLPDLFWYLSGTNQSIYIYITYRNDRMKITLLCFITGREPSCWMYLRFQGNQQIDAPDSCERSIPFHQSTWHHIPQDSKRHSHHNKNFQVLPNTKHHNTNQQLNCSMHVLSGTLPLSGLCLV